MSGEPVDRSYAVAALSDACREVNNGRYKLHHGPINVSQWDWSSMPWVAQLVATAIPVLRTAGDPFLREFFVLELATRVPEPERDTPPGFRQAVLDEMVGDALDIFRRAGLVARPDGDPAIMSFGRGEELVAEPSATLDFSVQGIRIGFTVDY